MKTPSISVVIATRNYGRFLAEAIESVRQQTVTDWELIIIDDGSTDHTRAVVSTFANDARIRLVTLNGVGQSRAKNLGIRLARAPYIAFLDGDDAWMPTKLEEQRRRFHERPNVGVVYSGRTLMNEQGIAQPTAACAPAPNDMLQTLFAGNPICFSSVMVRRSVFDHIGVFDPRLELGIDFDLWLRVSRTYAFDCVTEPLVRYRTGHANLSSRLVDRVATNMATQRQFLDRDGGRDLVPKSIARDTWFRSYQTLGYLFRGVNLRDSMRWYLRALGTGERPIGVLKAMTMAMIQSGQRAMKRLCGKAVPVTIAAENLPENG